MHITSALLHFPPFSIMSPLSAVSYILFFCNPSIWFYSYFISSNRLCSFCFLAAVAAGSGSASMPSHTTTVPSWGRVLKHVTDSSIFVPSSCSQITLFPSERSTINRIRSPALFCSFDIGILSSVFCILPTFGKHQILPCTFASCKAAASYLPAEKVRLFPSLVATMVPCSSVRNT